MKNVLVILILFGVVNILEGGEGETCCGFLKFSNSARASSLANSYSAYSGGSDMIFTNPGALSEVKNGEVHFTFTSYLGDSKLGLLSYKTSKDNLNIGFGVSVFQIGSIERRLNDTVGIVPASGSFDSRDSLIVVGISKNNIFSKTIDNLSGGINLKIINSKIDNKSANAFAIDTGFLYKYLDNLRFSFVLSNLGTDIKYVSESDKLPLSIKVGGLYKLNDDINISGEVEDFIYDEKIYPSIGFEWSVHRKLVLRAGYKFGYDTSNLGSFVGLGIGFGIVTKEISLNYAYLPFGDLGNINKFDLALRF